MHADVAKLANELFAFLQTHPHKGKAIAKDMRIAFEQFKLGTRHKSSEGTYNTPSRSLPSPTNHQKDNTMDPTIINLKDNKGQDVQISAEMLRKATEQFNAVAASAIPQPSSAHVQPGVDQSAHDKIDVLATSVGLLMKKLDRPAAPTPVQAVVAKDGEYVLSVDDCALVDREAAMEVRKEIAKDYSLALNIRRISWKLLEVAGVAIMYGAAFILGVWVIQKIWRGPVDGPMPALG